MRTGFSGEEHVDSNVSPHKWLPNAFPGLSREPCAITSPKSGSYNCIAWAAGDSRRWWWPHDYYWPEGCSREETISAFIQAFDTLGYSPTDNGGLVDGVEKVALYAIEDTPTHAALQLDNGWWTSKLGTGVDICHTLTGLEASSLYGNVSLFLERPRQV